METMSDVRSIVLITKEEIPTLKFANAEGLMTLEEKIQRDSQLQKAMILGNANHVKCKIVFNTKDGFRKVETTVWAVDDKQLSLKSGIHIPINAIHRIDFI